MTNPTRLLLLPGLMCDHASWQPVLPGLSQAADVQVIDYGQADSLVDMAALVLSEASPRFAMAGHSMGGRVALEVMRLAPERVTHLALLDTGYLPKASGSAGEDEAHKRQRLLDVARSQGMRAMALQWVQGMVAPHRLSDRLLIEAILDMFERKNADLFERQIRALLSRPDATPVLQALDLPTLVLCGALDSWATPAQHQAMADWMSTQKPQATTVTTIGQAGHMVMMEQAAEVTTALQRWLKQVPSLTC